MKQLYSAILLWTALFIANVSAKPLPWSDLFPLLNITLPTWTTLEQNKLPYVLVSRVDSVPSSPPPPPPVPTVADRYPYFYIDNTVLPPPPIENPPPRYTKMIHGYIDAIHLAYSASEFEPDNEIFLKYFWPDDYCTVLKVFNTILGIGDTPPTSIPNRLIYTNLGIFTGATGLPPTIDICSDSSRVGRGVMLDHTNNQGIPPGNGVIILCPVSFWYPDLDDIHCGSLEEVGSAMRTMGTTILHEMVHWRALIDAQLGFHISDYHRPPGARGEPFSGYGAYATRLLRNLGGGWRNADSYAWFATEMYFSAACATEYEEAELSEELPDELDFDLELVTSVGLPTAAPTLNP